MTKKLGKYETRDELVQNIHFSYHHEEQDKAQIAKSTGVSEVIVNNILRQKKSKGQY